VREIEEKTFSVWGYFAEARARTREDLLQEFWVKEVIFLFLCYWRKN